MSEHNATCTSIIDLITQLNTHLATRGWTSDHLDTTATATTGGEWAMSLGNVRFATSWDSENSGVNLAIYQYSDQAYVIGDRPWGQDHDSGNGFAGSTPDASIDNARHVVLAAAPIQFWVFTPSLTSTEVYAHIVVEISTGNFVHFGFGSLNKKGDWTGGEYAYGQFNNGSNASSGVINVDAASYALDGMLNDGTGITDAELYAATIHCEGLPNQPAGGMWAVSMGGSVGSGTQSVYGTDRQSNDGLSSDADRVMFFDGLRSGPWPTKFYRSAGADIGGEMRMWPIAPRYYDSTDGHVYGPMGFMPRVYGCTLPGDIPTAQVYTDETTSYYVFPANRVWSTGDTSSSGHLGIVYAISDAETELTPSDFAALSAHWDASDVANLTLEDNGRVSTWDDLSAGGHDLLQTTDANRPIWFTDPVTGLDAIRFKAASDHYLSVASHADLDVGTGDMLINIVYRQDTKAAGALMAKGNTATVSARWVARTDGTGDSDTDSGFELEHNDNVASGDVTNTESTQDWCEGGWTLLTYLIDQTSGSLARIWKDGVEIGSGTDISTVTTLLNTQPLLVGVEESTAFANAFDGEIGEISMIQENPGDASIDLLNTYFTDKWSIGVDSYVDPGLPASVGTPTGWYSSRSTNDMTIVSGEVTQLNDKSGNGNHLTPDGGTGPGLRKVRGLNWMNFESATPTVCRGDNTDINPGSGDFSCVCVFRSSTTTRQGLFYKIADVNEYFGTYLAFTSSRSMRYAMRDTVFGNTLALEHNDADNDYSDGEFKVMSFTYDDSEADAFLFGTRGPLAQVDAQDAVVENLTWASGDIIPAAEFELGAWNNAEDLDGQIAEMIFFNTPLSDNARAELYEYLYEKWNLTPYYTDPGLPTLTPTVTARWSALDEADMTLSGSEVTVLSDLTVNGNDFTVPAGKTGPAHRWIRGRKWLHYEAGSGWVMSQPNVPDTEPGASDFELIVVYKAESPVSATDGALYGLNSGTENFGMFIRLATGYLYYQMGTNGGNTAAITDTGAAHDDTDPRIGRAFFDYSADDVYLYGNDPTDISSVSASDLTTPLADIDPTGDVYLGDWSSSYGAQFYGQIAEVIVLSGNISSASQLTALQTYLSEKWGVEL